MMKKFNALVEVIQLKLVEVYAEDYSDAENKINDFDYEWDESIEEEEVMKIQEIKQVGEY